MKLVNIIPVILISIFINSIYSQNDYCGTNDNPSLNVANSNSSCNFFDHTNYSASINENYLNSFPQVSIDLVIWGYENLDGDKTISQEDANNILESLNNVYGEFNICFNLIHFNHIVSNLGYN